jgi:hypothetical protein
MVFAKTLLAQALSALSLEIDGGGIEEDKIKPAEKMPIVAKHSFLDEILRTSRGKRSGAVLVVGFFPDEGHGPVEMMEFDLIGPTHEIISAPFVAEAVRAAHHQPMEDCEKDRPLHVKEEVAIRENILNGFADPKILPEPLKYECRAYPLGISTDLAFFRKDQQRLFRKSGKRSNECFDLSLGVHLIEPAKSCNNMLVDLGAFPMVFDNLEVLVLAGLFDSSEHVEASLKDTSTLRDNRLQNQYKSADSVALQISNFFGAL